MRAGFCLSRRNQLAQRIQECLSSRELLPRRSHGTRLSCRNVWQLNGTHGLVRVLPLSSRLLLSRSNRGLPGSQAAVSLGTLLRVGDGYQIRAPLSRRDLQHRGRSPACRSVPGLQGWEVLQRRGWNRRSSLLERSLLSRTLSQPDSVS